MQWYVRITEKQAVTNDTSGCGSYSSMWESKRRSGESVLILTSKDLGLVLIRSANYG